MQPVLFVNQDEPQKSNKLWADCFHKAKQKATSDQGFQPATQEAQEDLHSPKLVCRRVPLEQPPLAKERTGQQLIADLGASCSLKRSSHMSLWNKKQTARRPWMSFEQLDLLPNSQSHLFQRDLLHWSDWVGLKVFFVAQPQALTESLDLLKSHKAQD